MNSIGTLTCTHVFPEADIPWVAVVVDECLWKVFQNLPDVGNVVNSQGHEGNSANTRYTYASEDIFPTYRNFTKDSEGGFYYI